MSVDLPKCDPNVDTDNPANFYETSADNNSFLNRSNLDLFTSILEIPKCLRESNDLTLLQMSVKNFPIPTINIPKQNTTFAGLSRNESSKTVAPYDNITIQIKIGNNLDNYELLYNWMNLLIDLKTGQRQEISKSEYETTFSVLLLDEYKKPVGMYVFDGVFPVSLGGINLDFSNSDSVFVDFTFSFDVVFFDKNPNY